MTVEHDDIETVLGPLRDSHGRDQRVLWLSDMPEKAFRQSSESPVCDWTGDSSRAELMDFAERLKTDRKAAFENLRTAEEEIAAMNPVAFLAFPHAIPVLARGHRWSLIQHQIAGVCVGQQRFCGLRLTMNTDIAELAVRLHRQFYGTSLGCGRPGLSTLVGYSDMLKSVELDCEETYPHLAEGFYPIDFSQEALDRVAVEAPRFADLIGEPVPYGGAEARAIIAIVAPNSD
jgi:hypothetical protein